MDDPLKPMSDAEVEEMLGHAEDRIPEEVKRAKPLVKRGAWAKIQYGPFAGMEGEVIEVRESEGLVRVQLSVLGRPVAPELEHWRVELVDRRHP